MTASSVRISRKRRTFRSSGARSLTCAIDDIRRDFFINFVDTDELVEERMNEGELMKYTVQLAPIPGAEAAASEVTVAKDGYKNFYRGQGFGDEGVVVDEEKEEEDDDDDDKVNVKEGVDWLNGTFAGMMNGEAKTGCGQV